MRIYDISKEDLFIAYNRVSTENKELRECLDSIEKRNKRISPPRPFTSTPSFINTLKKVDRNLYYRVKSKKETIKKLNKRVTELKQAKRLLQQEFKVLLDKRT